MSASKRAPFLAGFALAALTACGDKPKESGLAKVDCPPPSAPVVICPQEDRKIPPSFEAPLDDEQMMPPPSAFPAPRAAPLDENAIREMERHHQEEGARRITELLNGKAVPQPLKDILKGASVSVAAQVDFGDNTETKNVSLAFSASNLNCKALLNYLNSPNSSHLDQAPVKGMLRELVGKGETIMRGKFDKTTLPPKVKEAIENDPITGTVFKVLPQAQFDYMLICKSEPI